MIAGRYTLEREIGRGGMGAVWLGRDELLGREVALKQVGWVPGGAATDLARAEREARLAARLSHPHVVAVYDLVTEGEQQWLVMEYVEGENLATLVQREGPLSPGRAAALLCQAADALAAAHAAGIVHRDVKPSNILVSTDGQVKLSDFGIARAEADASLTQTGLVTGSPAYLSPEVASGELAQPPSDVWSLGATLFHALSGRPPYDVGENVLGALYRIVHEEPPRLIDAGWLDPVLRATMAKDPSARWSMAHVRDVLAQGPEASPPPPPPPAEDTRQLAPAPAPQPASRRSRRPLAIGAVAAAVVAIALLSALAWRLGSGDGRPDGDNGGDRAAAPQSSSPTPTADPTPEVTAAGMEQFVREYLATVTTDPRAAWDRLSPGFQAESGNFGRYRGFWRTVRSADVLSAQADPETMQVSYRVAYELANGRSTEEDVTLTLEGADGDFRIAGES